MMTTTNEVVIGSFLTDAALLLSVWFVHMLAFSNLTRSGHTRRDLFSDVARLLSD